MQRIRCDIGSFANCVSIAADGSLGAPVPSGTDFSGYRPTPEVFWVGPGYDEHDLPPLPEHARGIEGRASEDETYSAL